PVAIEVTDVRAAERRLRQRAQSIVVDVPRAQLGAVRENALAFRRTRHLGEHAAIARAPGDLLDAMDLVRPRGVGEHADDRASDDVCLLDAVADLHGAKIADRRVRNSATDRTLGSR